MILTFFSILDAGECARFLGVPITEYHGYRACSNELMKHAIIRIINVVINDNSLFNL